MIGFNSTLEKRLMSLKIVKDERTNIPDLRATMDNFLDGLNKIIQEKNAYYEDIIFTPTDIMIILKEVLSKIIAASQMKVGSKFISPATALSKITERGIDDLTLTDIDLNSYINNLKEILPKYLPSAVITEVFGITDIIESAPTYIDDVNGNHIFQLNGDWDKQIDAMMTGIPYEIGGSTLEVKFYIE
jgi:hypothetical protein